MNKTNPPKKITPAYVRKNQNTLFVFGDNDLREGKGGQAAIRDEPNAMGLRTKKKPKTTEDSYYSDEEYESNIRKMSNDLNKIKEASKQYQSTYYIPGIGEGRAKLKQKAPKTYRWLKNKLNELNRVHVVIDGSPKEDKKLRAVFTFPDGRKQTTHFGGKHYSDYTIHKDKDRKKRYDTRHSKREDWEDFTTAGALSKWILWNKPSLKGSFNHYLALFSLTGELKVKTSLPGYIPAHRNPKTPEGREFPERYLTGLNATEKAIAKYEIDRGYEYDEADPEAYKFWKSDIMAKARGMEIVPSKYRIGFIERYGPLAKGGDFITKISQATGISKDILKKVEKKGLAAWRIGHRPGVTQQQWARGRVYAFVMGADSSTAKGKSDYKLAVQAGIRNPPKMKESGEWWWFASHEGCSKGGKPQKIQRWDEREPDFTYPLPPKRLSNKKEMEGFISTPSIYVATGKHRGLKRTLHVCESCGEEVARAPVRKKTRAKDGYDEKAVDGFTDYFVKFVKASPLENPPATMQTGFQTIGKTSSHGKLYLGGGKTKDATRTESPNEKHDYYGSRYKKTHDNLDDPDFSPLPFISRAWKKSTFKKQPETEYEYWTGQLEEDETPYIATLKIDGEGTLAHFDGKETVIWNWYDRWRANFHITEEITKALKANKVKSAILMGELFAVDREGKMLPLNGGETIDGFSETVTSIIKTTGEKSTLERQERMKWAAFDILELNGEPTKDLPYDERIALVGTLVGGGKSIFAIPREMGKGKSPLESMWQKGMLEPEFEGAVIRFPSTGKSYKVKGQATADMAVIGLFNGGVEREGHKGGFSDIMGGLALAFMDDNGDYIYSGNIGTGFNVDDRKEWRTKADSGTYKLLPTLSDVRMWGNHELATSLASTKHQENGKGRMFAIDPKTAPIIKAEYRSINYSEKPVYRVIRGVLTQIGTTRAPALQQASYKGIRTDKEHTPFDLRLSQVVPEGEGKWFENPPEITVKPDFSLPEDICCPICKRCGDCICEDNPPLDGRKRTLPVRSGVAGLLGFRVEGKTAAAVYSSQEKAIADSNNFHRQCKKKLGKDTILLQTRLSNICHPPESPPIETHTETGSPFYKAIIQHTRSWDEPPTEYQLCLVSGRKTKMNPPEYFAYNGEAQIVYENPPEPIPGMEIQQYTLRFDLDVGDAMMTAENLINLYDYRLEKENILTGHYTLSTPYVDKLRVGIQQNRGTVMIWSAHMASENGAELMLIKRDLGVAAETLSNPQPMKGNLDRLPLSQLRSVWNKARNKMKKEERSLPKETWDNEDKLRKAVKQKIEEGIINYENTSKGSQTQEKEGKKDQKDKEGKKDQKDKGDQKKGSKSKTTTKKRVKDLSTAVSKEVIGKTTRRKIWKPPKDEDEKEETKSNPGGYADAYLEHHIPLDDSKVKSTYRKEKLRGKIGSQEFFNQLHEKVQDFGEASGFIKDNTIYWKPGHRAKNEVELAGNMVAGAKAFFHTHPKAWEPSQTSQDDFIVYHGMFSALSIPHHFTVMGDRCDWFKFENRIKGEEMAEISEEFEQDIREIYDDAENEFLENGGEEKPLNERTKHINKRLCQHLPEYKAKYRCYQYAPTTIMS